MEVGHGVFSSQSRLVLTPAGAQWVQEQLQQSNGASHTNGTTLATLPGAPVILPLPPQPQWIAGHHTLWWGANVVKRFPHPAGSQEPLLDIIEAAHWKQPVSTAPLRQRGQALKTTVRNTVYRLSEHQEVPLIEFSSDGSGHYVLWRRRD